MRIAIIFCIVLGAFSQSRTLAGTPIQLNHHAGVAKIDITPDYPVRLAGFGFRRTESEGVTQQIHASALAIDDGGDPIVLDHRRPVRRAGERSPRNWRSGCRPPAFKPERFTLAVTHSHTTPMVAGYLRHCSASRSRRSTSDTSTASRPNCSTSWKRSRRMRSPIASRPKLSWGVGSVGFAKNRRTAGGPTDHDLPVLVVRDPDGKLRAVWTSYACHCVTLSNNKISGDWAGFAKEAIEADNPGAVALISIGCGADQNPNSGVTGDKVEMADRPGPGSCRRGQAAARRFPRADHRADRVAESEHVELPLVDLPPRIGVGRKGQSDRSETGRGRLSRQGAARPAGPRRSACHQSRLTPCRPGPSATTWRWSSCPAKSSSITRCGSKRNSTAGESGSTPTRNDVPCYIPSERVLKEGGYEGGGAMIYYDLPGPFKPGLEQTDHRCRPAVPSARRSAAQFDPTKTNGRPLSPQQSLATIRAATGVTAELMAAEPLVASPVAIAFGPDGRLWVAEMYDYPSRHRRQVPARRPDSRAASHASRERRPVYDQSTVFLDNIPFPTGVTVWRNGVLVCAAPDILYAEDTKPARARPTWSKSSSAASARTTTRPASTAWNTVSTAGSTARAACSAARSPASRGKKLALGNRDFRIKPDTGEIEPATGRTQQGRVRDDWDNWFGCDNTHLAWHYPLPDHYIRRNPHAAPPNPAVSARRRRIRRSCFPAGNLQLFKLSGPPGRPTAVCGIGVYRDDLLGKEVTGDLFACEPVNLLVHRMKLVPKGSTFAGVRPPGEEKTRIPDVHRPVVPPGAGSHGPGRLPVGRGHAPLRDRASALDSAGGLGEGRRAGRGDAGPHFPHSADGPRAAADAAAGQARQRGFGRGAGQPQRLRSAIWRCRCCCGATPRTRRRRWRRWRWSVRGPKRGCTLCARSTGSAN